MTAFCLVCNHATQEQDELYCILTGSYVGVISDLAHQYTPDSCPLPEDEKVIPPLKRIGPTRLKYKAIMSPRELVRYSDAPACFGEKWDTLLECKECNRWGDCQMQARCAQDSLSDDVKIKLGYHISTPGDEFYCLTCGVVLYGYWGGVIVMNGRRGTLMCDACIDARKAAIAAIEVASGLTPERLTELKTMKYCEYLLTPEWQATRFRALKRANNRCQYCGWRKGLHVHHRTYATRGCERDEDVIVLCSWCHESSHGIRRNWMPPMASDAE